MDRCNPFFLPCEEVVGPPRRRTNCELPAVTIVHDSPHPVGPLRMLCFGHFLENKQTKDGLNRYAAWLNQDGTVETPVHRPAGCPIE